MAGAGYKLFVNGNTLSASDLNTYIQQQTVMVFTDSTARTTALSGVVSAGMISYLTGTNSLETYNGSAWVANGVGDVTLTGTQTLTNKTLTAPVISTISNTGTLTLPTSTDTLVGRATTDTLTNKTLTSPVISSISNTGTLTLPTSSDTLVGRATTDTLTNKTLTSPVISSIVNTGTLTLPTATDTLVARTTTDTLTNKFFQAPNEVVQIIGTGFAGYTFDVLSGGVVNITAASTANGTINFRGNSGTALNSVLATGQSVSCVLAITNTTAFYPTAFQVDGSAVTPKWSGGTAPSSGNASAIDVYSFTIIKTGSAAYTVLAGGATKFA